MGRSGAAALALLMSLGCREDVARRMPLDEAVALDLEHHRRLEARLWGASGWSPCEPVQGLESRLVTVKRCDDEAYPQPARSELEPSNEPQLNWLRARARLMWHRPSTTGLVRALGALRSLTLELPDDPRVWTDLSVAYYERAQATDDPDDLLRALDAVERAITLDPGAISALFNRGLILGELALAGTAAEAWTQYLNRDPSSPWAEEVRRLAFQPREAVGNEVQERRILILEETLPNWGRPLLAGRPATPEMREQIEQLGRALQSSPSDRSPADAVRAAVHLLDSPELSTRAARGRLAYSEGMALYQEALDADAKQRLELATRLLAGTGDPTGLWASMQLGWLSVYQGQYAAALERWRSVERGIGDRPYPALLGRIHWGRGVVALRTGDFERAASEYQASLSRFEQAAETLNRAVLKYLIAENLDNLGRQREASQAMLESLRGLESHAGSVWRHQLLRFAGIRARELGLGEASRRLHDEGVSSARLNGLPQYVAEALLWRGRSLRSLGRYEAAAADLRAAEAEWRRMPAGDMSDRIAADLSAARADLAQQTGAADAVALYDAALGYFEKLGLETSIPTLLMGRADAQIARGDRRAAMVDLEAAAALFDRQGRNLHGARNRIGHREATVRYFDSLIELAIAEGEVEQALDLATQSRAALSNDAETSCRVRHIQEEVLQSARGLGVLHFAKTEKRLFAWLVTATTLDQHELPAERAETTLTTMLAAIDADGPWQAAARDLYEALITPFAEELRQLTALTIVPDKLLAQVPWGALEDPETGELLLEKGPLSLAPSLCLAPPKTDRPPLDAAASIGVVADPTLNAADRSSLASLPSARQEAGAIADLYADATVYAGSVDESDFLRLLGRHEVVHFVGHAVHNRRHPELSFLALSSTDETGGALEARDILDLDLGGLRLVVLAACDTLVSRPGRADVLLGLANSFLTAGTEQVVGTLWPVDDRATAALMKDFHTFLAHRSSASEALRRAQLQAHQSGLPPRHWAAFQVWSTRNP